MKDENGYPLRFSEDAKKILLDMGYFDDRPLTDETLKELGFKGTGYSDEYMQDTPQSLTTDGGVVLMVWHQEGWDGDKIWVEIANCTDEKRPKFKTVGSVKMLIEALKGDE